MTIQTFTSYSAAINADFPEDITVSTVSLSTLNTDLTTLAGQVTTAQGADLTAVTNAVATLVADGASPTQAHVTALNSAYTTLKAAVNAISTATVAADVTALSTVLQGDEIALYNQASALSTETARLIGDVFERRLADSRYGPADLGSI
jgi:stress response protein SCP2